MIDDKNVLLKITSPHAKIVVTRQQNKSKVENSNKIPCFWTKDPMSC